MAPTQREETAKDYLTIGRLVKSLKGRYPDLTISKIRYLEDEGLLSPERTSGGYRKFSPRDVQRLEVIMQLQTAHFLPLAVIRQRLVDLDSGRMPAELSGTVSAEVLTLPLTDTTSVGADEIAAVTGVGADVIRELESFGLVKATQTADGRVYGPLDVEILKACRGLAHFGIEPRHLRMYGTFAQRESAFFSQIVLPAMRQAHADGKEKKKVADELQELSEGTQRLHGLLLRRAMRSDFGDEAP